VQSVLKAATEECNNPDLRDRGYMYWRMLSKNPELAKQVVLSERPTISDDSFALQPRLLDRLVTNISTLASVYHQLPETFITTEKGQVPEEDSDAELEDGADTENIVREMERRRRTGGDEYMEEVLPAPAVVRAQTVAVWFLERTKMGAHQHRLCVHLPKSLPSRRLGREAHKGFE